MDAIKLRINEIIVTLFTELIPKSIPVAIVISSFRANGSRPKNKNTVQAADIIPFFFAQSLDRSAMEKIM